MNVNGHMKTVIGAGSVLVALIGGAIGYGSLKADTTTNGRRLDALEHAVELRSTDPTQSAVGQRLILGIEDLQRRMARMEQQIESLQVEVRRQRR